MHNFPILFNMRAFTWSVGILFKVYPKWMHFSFYFLLLSHIFCIMSCLPCPHISLYNWLLHTHQINYKHNHAFIPIQFFFHYCYSFFFILSKHQYQLHFHLSNNFRYGFSDALAPNKCQNEKLISKRRRGAAQLLSFILIANQIRILISILYITVSW